MPRSERFSPRQFGSAMRRGGITRARLVTSALVGAMLGAVVGLWCWR